MLRSPPLCKLRRLLGTTVALKSELHLTISTVRRERHTGKYSLQEPIIQQLGEEILICDVQRGVVHNLNGVLAEVYQQYQEGTLEGTLSEKQEYGLALLADTGLVEARPLSKDRRTFLKDMLLAASALPVLASVGLPRPLSAASVAAAAGGGIVSDCTTAPDGVCSACDSLDPNFLCLTLQCASGDLEAGGWTVVGGMAKICLDVTAYSACLNQSCLVAQANAEDTSIGPFSCGTGGAIFGCCSP